MKGFKLGLELEGAVGMSSFCIGEHPVITVQMRRGSVAEYHHKTPTRGTAPMLKPTNSTIAI